MFVLLAPQELQSFPNSSLDEVQKYISKEMLLTFTVQLAAKQQKNI